MSRESEIVLYVAPSGTVKIGVLLRDETARLTQKSLVELFGVPAINKHLADIFESGELSPRGNCFQSENSSAGAVHARSEVRVSRESEIGLPWAGGVA